MFLNPIVTRVINEWFFLKQRFSTYIQQIAFLPVGLVYNTLLEEILAEGNFGGVSRLAQIPPSFLKILVKCFSAKKNYPHEGPSSFHISTKPFNQNLVIFGICQN